MKNVDKVKKGDWIFTCSLEPMQFSHFEPKTPEDYNASFLSSMDEEELSNFLNDDFVTMNGSSHSYKNCTCKVVTEDYAKWFIANNVQALFNQFENQPTPFALYENAVRLLCQQHNISFEGI